MEEFEVGRFRRRPDLLVRELLDSFWSLLKRRYTSILPWIIILIGVVLRFVQYLYNRSLWVDESLIALNVVERSFFGLLFPLNYGQSAPIGFMLVEKLAVQVFGNNEYALRLFPLICGIVSLILFYEAAKRWICPKAVPIALSLFVILEPLIYYSSEVKPYSSDVAIALLIFLVTDLIISNNQTLQRTFLLGIMGSIALWFSHPSLFILTGMGVTLTIFQICRKEWPKTGNFSIAYSFWAVSFIVNYFGNLRHIDRRDHLKSYFSNYFMPFPPMSVPELKWIPDNFISIFEYPVGLTLSGIAALCFLVGCIAIYSARKETFLILISPLFVALLMSGLHKYPFGGRLLLFMVPSLLLCISEGIWQIRDGTRRSVPALGIILLALLFFNPIFNASSHLTKPIYQKEIKPVLKYLVNKRQNDDVLYIYWGSVPAFRYYAEKYGFNKNNYTLGVTFHDGLKGYTDDLNKLMGSERVWIVFTHNYKKFVLDEKHFFLYYLDGIGTRLDSYERAGASVYLYSLNKTLE